MTVVPIELNANKPRVAVRVNGSEPLDFLVDTGSIFDLVDAERAAELGIASAGDYDASGAGEATMSLETATGVRLALGDLDLPAQTVRVAPINAAIGAFEGRRLDGLLGYDFFERFPVELDYAGGTLALGREPRGTPVPLQLVRRHPFVHASFVLGGRIFERDFLVDTGFRSGLVLNAPFVTEEGLVGLAGHTIEATTGSGIGGPTVERVGRAERLELGPFVLESPIVNLSLATAGTLAERNMGGIIGSEVLRRFTAVFDYPGARMLLEPNAAFHEPFEFDLSGLFLSAGATGIEVFRVVEGSPAHEAGIRQGDLIRSEHSIEELRRLFRQAPGKEHELEVERGTERFRVTLRLRRMV